MVPFLNGKAADPATRFTFAQTWRRDDTGCRDDRPQLGSSRRSLLRSTSSFQLATLCRGHPVNGRQTR